MAMRVSERMKKVDAKYYRDDIPNFDVGDTIKMTVKVQEADKIRSHPFEGTVIRKTGRGVKATFTVRKISFGEGVERGLPGPSLVIESQKVISKGFSNLSNLYSLRDRAGKSARVRKQLNP